jgi:hypothetical protein
MLFQSGLRVLFYYAASGGSHQQQAARFKQQGFLWKEIGPHLVA